MPTHRQLVARTIVGLLLIVLAAACNVPPRLAMLFGPDLHIDIDNEGPKEVTVTVDSSGTDMTDATVPHNQGAEWSVPLGSTWEVKVDGKHVIGSGDRTDVALPSPGQRRDLVINIQVAKDGTVKLLDAP